MGASAFGQVGVPQLSHPRFPGTSSVASAAGDYDPSSLGAIDSGKLKDPWVSQGFGVVFFLTLPSLTLPVLQCKPVLAGGLLAFSVLLC